MVRKFVSLLAACRIGEDPKGLAWYLRHHFGEMLAALLLSVVPSVCLVSEAFLHLYEEHEHDLKAVYYTDECTDLVTCFFFVTMPIALLIYLIFRFGGEAHPGGKGMATLYRVESRKEAAEKRRDGFWYGFRILVAAALAFVLVSWRHDWSMFGAVTTYIEDAKTIPYLEFIGALLILAIAAAGARIFTFIRSGEARTYRWFICLVLMTISSVISYVSMELYIGSKTNVLGRMQPYNLMYWFLLWLFLYAILRMPRITSLLSFAAAIVIGVGNYCTLQFRGNYVMSGDLRAFRTALSVLDHYKLKVDHYFIGASALLAAGILLVLIIRPAKKERTTKRRFLPRLATTFLAVTLIGVFTVVAFDDGFLYGDIFGLAWDYNKNVTKNGYIPYFLSNMHATVRIDMSDYTPEQAEQAMRNILDDPELAESPAGKDAAGSDAQYPTILVIQNEAFADLSVVADIETNKDPMPFIHHLTEDTIKGYVDMSVTGGPTANTEFEFLSRTTLHFLPTGCVPYTQYLKQEIPSICMALKSQKVPYRTIAFHPYYASGYNRNSVYDFLDFDEKVFYENWDDKKKLRGLETDRNDYEDVIAMYEQHKAEHPDQPLFLFNVTIQNHGGYSNNAIKFADPVKVTSYEVPRALDNYLSLVRASDTAFEFLLDYFAKVDEKVIILFYGDHQPSLSDEVKKVLTEHTIYPDDKALQKRSRYIVPYVIWANYDIPEADGMHEGGLSGDYHTMSMNYLASTLLQHAGVELSDYDRYLLGLHEELPSISALGLWGPDGTYYEKDPEGALGDLSAGLRQVQLNLLFDREEKLWESFLP